VTARRQNRQRPGGNLARTIRMDRPARDPNALVFASEDVRASLVLTLAGGATITVPADPQHEAWQVDGAADFVATCLPGTSGEFAFWPCDRARVPHLQLPT
jgi:hypothetical protein